MGRKNCQRTQRGRTMVKGTLEGGTMTEGRIAEGTEAGKRGRGVGHSVRGHGGEV